MIDVLTFCLALNVYFEARSEPQEGQIAVAEVTLRRAQQSGKSVCNEVFTDAQFSWTAQADELNVTNPKAWKDAQQIAEITVKYVDVLDYSKGATHFHADYVRPRWARSMCETARIGRHIFYKECP